MLFVVFSLISIPLLIPFLDILLQKKTSVEPAVPQGSMYSVQFAKDFLAHKLWYLQTQYGEERALIVVCVLLAASFFFKNIFKYLAQCCMAPVRNGIVADLRTALYTKTMRLPLGYFSEEKKGDLMSRILNDVTEIEWSILSVIEAMVREPLMVIGALVIMIWQSPWLTLFVFVLMIFTGALIGTIGRVLKRESHITQTRLSNMVSVLEETLGGLRVIKGFNADGYFLKRFNEENNGYRKAMNRAMRRRDASSPLTEFLGVSIVCVLVWYGYKQVSANAMTPSQFIAFLYAFYSIIDPAKTFSQAYFHLQKGTAALNRVDYILDAPETILDAPNAQTFSVLENKISFENVGFAYASNSDSAVLKNISFDIPKGKTIALVGSSGAGKSTIADLVLRFHDVTEGKICFDGVDIKNIQISALRNLFGIVTQEALLFNDTVANNIIFGAVPDNQNLLDAANAAYTTEFIDNLPQKFDTNIGDRGTKLSGGQRQRLTIARALYKSPQILIFDEATSALDSESEKIIQATLSELLIGRTALIIAHRLSTIQQADEILVLSNGEIVERGTHAELLSRNGDYKKWVMLQQL